MCNVLKCFKSFYYWLLFFFLELPRGTIWLYLWNMYPIIHSINQSKHRCPRTDGTFTSTGTSPVRLPIINGGEQPHDIHACVAVNGIQPGVFRKTEMPDPQCINPHHEHRARWINLHYFGQPIFGCFHLQKHLEKLLSETRCWIRRASVQTSKTFLHSEILRRIGLFGAMSGAEILPVWDAWMSPDFTPWGSSTSKASPRRRWCQTPMPWKKSWFFFSASTKLQPPTLNEAHTSWRD